MTSLDFSKFKRAIDRQFDKISKHDLFRTDVGKDQLWETYLSSFPTGTNPTYRERSEHDCSCCRQFRSEHDCSCCRQFIKAVGNVVAIIDGKVVSIWDIEIDEPAYQLVADSMAQLVKAHKVTDVFLHPEKTAGTDRNFEDDNGKVITWNHFHVNIPWGRNQGKNYYRIKKEIPTLLGISRDVHDVLLRGLTELTQDSVDTVLDIIRQNSLYRGNEYQSNVKVFDRMKRAFDKLGTEQAKDLFVWENFDKVSSGAVSKIRNTAIGTLLIDLSAGEDLEGAVRKFETSIMAPSNYKRSTALVSQKMVDAAKVAVEELGLTSALERRYAKLADVRVNDIIFANREARGAMLGGAFAGIANKATTPKNLDKVETVSIEKFINDIVPQVDSIEVFVENRYINNLVSLVAPAYKGAKSLFKWDNDFSWSYNGDFTDSIKERVKRAGGNVTGDLACRLAWSNYDDLDFHMKEPGFEIFYVAKRSPVTGGQLDVDMNAGSGHTREPVENIFYGDQRTMKEGNYELFVHQFMKRETTDVGFEAEIDYLGDVKRYTYGKPLSQGEKVVVAKFKYTHTGGIEITESLTESNASKTVWNIKTQDFHKVNVFMLSPNYWEGEAVGNKHYFFMLEGCVNDGQARGFFNEFLKPDLDKHRKVLEIVGSKMKVEESNDQLSGLGFSDTKRAEVLVRVKGSFTRLLKVMI